MANSTAPILAAGGITFVNKWIGNGQGKPSGIDLKIVVATGAAALVLALVEKASEPFAVGIAWITLITALLVKPANGNAPITNAINITGIGKT